MWSVAMAYTRAKIAGSLASCSKFVTKLTSFLLRGCCTARRFDSQRSVDWHHREMSSKLKKLTTEKALAELDGDTTATALKLVERGIQQIETLLLSQLRTLDLGNNSLTRIRALQGCPQVSHLKCDHNKLTGEGLDGVRALEGLKVLNASHNQVRLAHTSCSCPGNYS